MKSRVRRIPISEREYLHEHGLFRFSKDRTRGLVRSHVNANSGLETLARDCYLQGIRDAAQATDHDEHK